MKILIWFLAALIFGLTNAVFIENDILLGGIPTALLTLACILLAKFLCRAWDKRKAKKAVEQVTQPPKCEDVAHEISEQSVVIAETSEAADQLIAPQPQKVAEKPIGEKTGRGWRIACFVLSLCVVILSVSLIYCITLYDSLDSENWSLSREVNELGNKLDELENVSKWSTSWLGRNDAKEDATRALMRFFYCYGEDAWEELGEILSSLGYLG